MTNELEKQFFDTFGIEPEIFTGCKLEKNNWKEDACPFEKDGIMELCHKVCKYAFTEQEIYPQITDHILLGIIAKIMWSYSCTQNDFDAYEVHTVDNLREAVLKHAIELSKNDAYVYWGVRTLFEEG